MGLENEAQLAERVPDLRQDFSEKETELTLDLFYLLVNIFCRDKKSKS